MVAFGILWHPLVWPGFWHGIFLAYPLSIIASSFPLHVICSRLSFWLPTTLLHMSVLAWSPLNSAMIGPKLSWERKRVGVWCPQAVKTHRQIQIQHKQYNIFRSYQLISEEKKFGKVHYVVNGRRQKKERQTTSTLARWHQGYNKLLEMQEDGHDNHQKSDATWRDKVTRWMSVERTTSSPTHVISGHDATRMKYMEQQQIWATTKGQERRREANEMRMLRWMKDKIWNDERTCERTNTSGISHEWLRRSLRKAYSWTGN